MVDEFFEQLSHDLEGYSSLILSHEFLFQNPYAINRICHIAKDLAEEISIIGYSRKQSDYIVSAYCQWWFRSFDRITEINAIVSKLGLNPDLFTGLERQIIASIVDDFFSARQLSGYSILDWNKSYEKIIELTRETCARVICGVLPNKESDTSLIQDFCKKADLTLNPKLIDASKMITNLSFDHDVVEAINIAVSLGLRVMGPHEDNQIIALLSSLSPRKQKISGFLSDLKSYVNTYFWESILALCNQFKLDQAYFTPSHEFDKQEILEAIAREAQIRTLNMPAVIEERRLLSARMIELCILLANKSNT